MSEQDSGSRLLTREGSALVIIDIQEKLLPAMSEGGGLVENIIKLIKFAKIIGLPIILTEQYPKGLGRTIKEIRDLLPDLSPIEKTAFSCLGSPEFRARLEQLGASKLIITGIETHVCVNQTALEALDNFRVYVIADAVSSRTRENWRIGLERLQREGAIISSAEMIMYELLRDAGTKEFKEASLLLK